MKTSKETHRRSKMEKLEIRINLTATFAGIDVSGTEWTSEFFPGADRWLPIKDGLQEDHAIGNAGFDKIRIRFTEPVKAEVDRGAIALIYQDGLLPGTIDENIHITDDGLSAIWELPEVAADELFAIRSKPGAFQDADDGDDVGGLLYELSVLPGDSDGDRAVTFADFLSLSGNFGTSGMRLADDFLPNGRVEFADFLLLSANFSKDLGTGSFSERHLVSGETTDSTLGLGDVNIFTLDAEGGESLFLTLSESVRSSTFNLDLEMYAPSGELILSNTATFNGTTFDEVELEQTGTYTILVHDNNHDAVGDYALTALAVDDQVDADNEVLRSGEVIQRTLDFADIDTFTLAANANKKLFLTIAEEERSSSFNPGLFIYGPRGDLIDSNGSIFNGFAISELALPESGNYTIVVRDSSADAIGQYSISAVVVDEQMDAGNVTLNSGETHIGNLAIGEIDTFTIDAEVNERFFLSLSEAVRSSAFNPGVFVYAPDGTLIISQSSVFNGQAFSDVVLPQAGTYTVVVRDASGDATGDYSITAVVIDEQLDVGNIMLASGETLSGLLDSADIDTYTFTAETDERLFLTLSDAVGSSSFNPGVFIYAPDGTLLNSVGSTVNGHAFSDLLLPQAGTYTVVVRDETADATGDYWMTLVLVDDQLDADNVSLVKEEPTFGTLSLGDIDTFTLVVGDNEKLQVTLTESVVSSAFNPGIFVYGPDSKLISSVPATINVAMITDIPLTKAGIYTFVIRDASGDLAGDYSILVNALES